MRKPGLIGGTGLPVILNDDLLSVPCMDVVEIHIQKFIAMILEDAAQFKKDGQHTRRSQI